MKQLKNRLHFTSNLIRHITVSGIKKIPKMVLKHPNSSKENADVLIWRTVFMNKDMFVYNKQSKAVPPAHPITY